MPMYCFRNQADGEVIERVYPIGKAPRRVRCNGKHYVRDIAAEHGQRSHVACSLWPKTSLAAGCHPDQIPEFKQHDREHGVTGITYTPDGDVQYASAKSKRDWLRAHGMIDRKAYC